MNQPAFQAVIDRLRLGVDVETETELGERLGFTQSAWSKRKMRGSLPKREIDALIAAEELNPEFIYNGTGNVHVPVDGESWEALYAKRAALVQVDDGWLSNRGHSATVITDLLTPKAGSKASKLLAAIRDLRLMKKVDLNWLIAADPQPAAAPALQPEKKKDAKPEAQKSSGAEIGSRLKQERQRLGFAEAEFAALAGYTRQAQLAYESGERSPDALYLNQACLQGLDVLFIVTGLRRSGVEEVQLIRDYMAAPEIGRKLIEQTARFAAQGTR